MNIPAVIPIPANQASMHIDTGGSSGNPLYNVNIPISQGLGGLNRIEYDNLFWSNDFFTVTTRNAAVGLFIGYYVPDLGASYCLLPIALPRQSLSLPSTDIEDYQQCLAFSLNLYFSKPQTVIAFDSDGRNPKRQVLDINNPNMPILQDTSQPPLVWRVSHSGQLILMQNDDDSIYAYLPDAYVFNFNLVQLTSSMMPTDVNSSVVSSKSNGWFGSGKYIYGFGKYDDNGQYVDDMTFYDVASVASKPFTSLCRVNQEFLPVGDLENFDEISDIYKMFQSVVSDSSALCIPSKYYVVDSKEITRNQLRPISTNIQRPISEAVAIIYTSPFGKNFYGATSPFMFNDASTPSIHLHPNQPHNQVDLNISNEFVTNATPYDYATDLDYMMNVDGFFEDPSVEYPPAYDGLNPFLNFQPDGWSAFPYYLINDNLFSVPLNPNHLFSANPSTNVIHFTKMLSAN